MQTQNQRQIQKSKQKQKIPVQVINSFNPQLIGRSKQTSPFIKQKIGKKMKVSQPATVIQHRVRQSRSQNKRQKLTNSNPIGINHNTQSKNNHKKQAYSNDQNNIFQSLELIAKNNSHHSLEKYSNMYSYGNGSHKVTSKIQEKLHLPTLVGVNGLKHTKSKVYHNVNVQEPNQTDIEKQNFYAYEGVTQTQKSSPYIQKIVKIPIDRLKPLKPEQIKLKYQKKVKEQQKNRAKQRALQIFSKQEEQNQKARNMVLDDDYDILQSDQNIPVDNGSKKTEISQIGHFRNKTSIIKNQKLIANSRNQNIFKKHLLLSNSNVPQY